VICSSANQAVYSKQARISSRFLQCRHRFFRAILLKESEQREHQDDSHDDNRVLKILEAARKTSATEITRAPVSSSGNPAFCKSSMPASAQGDPSYAIKIFIVSFTDHFSAQSLLFSIWKNVEP